MQPEQNKNKAYFLLDNNIHFTMDYTGLDQRDSRNSGISVVILKKMEIACNSQHKTKTNYSHKFS